jgi:long-subunit acyl-CoA synthetase (AMP-forming)
MLSHGNFLSIAYAAKTGGISVDENDSIVSYLPLAHSFE